MIHFIREFLMVRSLLVLTVMLSVVSETRAGPLDQEMLKAAPTVLEFLKDKSVRNVGVLKFASAEGAGKPTDVGEINRTVADRLEMALILKTAINNPIGVIRDATAAAAKIDGASHRSATGRAKLFAEKFPLAWGDEQVRPDAFLTGVVRIQKDRSLIVSIFAYLPDEAKALAVTNFTALPDVASLMESGGSFTTRGLFDDGKVETDPEKLKTKQAAVNKAALEAVLKVRDEPAQHPANKDVAPVVSVKIFYDGREQKVEFRDGDAWIAEPRDGQAVSFIIDHKDEKSGPLAVVLKVNGENTIEKQRLRDPECRKWVLQPGENYTVKGFLMAGDQKSEAFRVLSPRESMENEFRYGHEVGTISWSVYRSLPQDKKVEPIYKTLAELDVEYLNRGLFPKEQQKTLSQLRKALDSPNPDRDRGLIAEDKKNVVDTPTQKVEFVADPAPVLTASVRYYKAQK